MKTMTVLCVMVGLLLPGMVWAAETGGVAVRDCPMLDDRYKDANEIATLSEGDAVKIVRRKGGWVNISATGCQNCLVPTNKLDPAGAIAWNLMGPRLCGYGCGPLAAPSQSAVGHVDRSQSQSVSTQLATVAGVHRSVGWHES